MVASGGGNYGGIGGGGGGGAATKILIKTKFKACAFLIYITRRVYYKLGVVE